MVCSVPDPLPLHAQAVAVALVAVNVVAASPSQMVASFTVTVGRAFTVNVPLAGKLVQVLPSVTTTV